MLKTISYIIKDNKNCILHFSCIISFINKTSVVMNPPAAWPSHENEPQFHISHCFTY